MGRAEPGGADVRNCLQGDVAGHYARRVRTQAVRDGQQIGVVGLLLQLDDGETGHHLLVALLVAEAGVNQGADDREAIGKASVQREQLTDAHTGHAGRNGSIWAANLAGGVGLGVVGLQVAGPALQPDHNESRSLARRGRAGRHPTVEERRQRQAAESTHPQTQKCATWHAGRG